MRLRTGVDKTQTLSTAVDVRGITGKDLVPPLPPLPPPPPPLAESCGTFRLIAGGLQIGFVTA